MQTDAHGPLKGVRVVDASRVLAGPLCGQLLGDLGAEVIKVEQPGAGDETRTWGPPFAGAFSAYFLSCNRNKKGIAVDLARPEGRHILQGLLRQSDVLLENFRAASVDRLGLHPQKLLRLNPKLVICSISGFGRTGPWADLPGYDFAMQALSGLMDITGPVDGPPCKVGVAVTDVLTGLHAAVAVLACLHARDQSGHGYVIDLALLDCGVASQVNLAQAFLSSGQVPPRQGNAHLQIVPYQLFPTADSWLVLAVGNDGQWQRFCQVAGKPELADDARFAINTERVRNREILVPLVEAILRTRTAREWEKELSAQNVPCAPVWNYADLFSHPQAQARRLRVSVTDPEGRAVDLIGSPFHIDGATLPEATLPPALGQHTDAVLRDLLGMDEENLNQLRRQGVIG
jgi:crotonobetainyl-CoA:carnitine CoA-transferase CaiB-like acyl-CoA transferase